MTEQVHLSGDLGHDDQFEREMRGYNRRAVDEYVAALRIDLRSLEDSKRDLEDRLSQALDENERIKLDLSSARSAGKPPHEEISERIGQILKLADDEARSQRAKSEEEIAKQRAEAQAETTKLRAEAKAETDKSRAEAQEQAERMLSAAQEQADSTITAAKTEADKTRKSATTEAQQVVADATKQAETAVATAKAQAKQQLDEATARASAIHDGAERRLNMLTARHTETIRRLTEVRDVVTSLVAGETERGSLEEEVARSVSNAVGPAGKPGAERQHPERQPAERQPADRQAPVERGPGHQPGPAEGRHAVGQPDGPLQPLPPPRQPAGAQDGVHQHQGGSPRPSAAPGDGHRSGPDDARRYPGPARPRVSDDTADGLKIFRD